jgi:hypothetical protein
MIRDIKNYLDEVIGQMELPDETTESEWAEKLAPFCKSPKSTLEKQTEAITATIRQRREYAEDLIERFKLKNISEGINGLQAMYMHHKMRALGVTFCGVPMTLDLLNMVVSGDIEVACLSLLYCTPDDMTMSYHWLNSARVAWLVADMKAYLGWA